MGSCLNLRLRCKLFTTVQRTVAFSRAGSSRETTPEDNHEQAYVSEDATRDAMIPRPTPLRCDKDLRFSQCRLHGSVQGTCSRGHQKGQDQLHGLRARHHPMPEGSSRLSTIEATTMREACSLLHPSRPLPRRTCRLSRETRAKP